MSIVTLPIAACLFAAMLGATALPQATTYEVRMNRGYADAALSRAISARDSGWMSFKMWNTGIDNGPIAASCAMKPEHVPSDSLVSLKQPRAMTCRFAEARNRLPVRLDLRWTVGHGLDGAGSIISHAELVSDRLRVAIARPSAETSAPSAASTKNRYVFTINEIPAASLEIGEKSSVRVTPVIDPSARQAIMLAATAMTVLSSTSG